MRLRRLIKALFAIVFAFCLLGAGGDRSRFNDLGHRMMCVCGCNQILLECNHVGCQYSDRMRGELVTAVERDKSDDSVLQIFVQEYGATVLAAPTAQGFDKIAWIMPFAVLFAGFFMAVMVILKWKEHRSAGSLARMPAIAMDSYREQARRETEL